VFSDTVAAGKKEDTSGKAIVERLTGHGLNVCQYKVIPDDKAQIAQEVKRFADEMKLDLVVTTGGTGVSQRDCTPEAMAEVIEKDIPGISEAARGYGQERMPYAMLSRGRAGLRGQTLIVNLPGSRGGVVDSLDAVFPHVLHVFNMMRSGVHAK
jgi:molybdenum cofactor synthesis domain-containing protein